MGDLIWKECPLKAVLMQVFPDVRLAVRRSDTASSPVPAEFPSSEIARLDPSSTASYSLKALR
jgi:hypothetical protein